MSNKNLSELIKKKFTDLNYITTGALIGILACELTKLGYDFDDTCRVLENVQTGNIDCYKGA